VADENDILSVFSILVDNDLQQGDHGLCSVGIPRLGRES
jgi:hypothetical protein